jgi:hypothetical protein
MLVTQPSLSLRLGYHSSPRWGSNPVSCRALLVGPQIRVRTGLFLWASNPGSYRALLVRVAMGDGSGLHAFEGDAGVDWK